MRTLFHPLTAKIVDRFRNMSIQMVISLSFTAVAVMGVFCIGLSLLLCFSDLSKTQAQESAQRLLAQVNLNLDSYLHRMMRISDAMYYRVIKNTDLAEGTLASEMNLLYDENRDALVSIAVFNSDGGLEGAVPLSGMKASADPAESRWFQMAIERMENLHFSTPHIQEIFDDPDHRYRWVISLSRYVQLTRGGNTESGVLLVDMSFSGISQVCRNVELPNSGYLYLTDRTGELIYHPRQQMIYTGLLEENNLKAAGYPDGVHEEEFQGTRWQVVVKTVGYTGWKLVGMVPESGLIGDSDSLLPFGASLLLFSAFLMAFLNFRISAYISDPIRRLEQAVKDLEAGCESIEIEETGCYEVRRLGRSIRSMVSTMRHLMDDIIQQESQKRRSELEVLQSQINPHFLYNTLDSVIWMTESGRNMEAIQMVTSLARLFRISLSKGRRVIPLADELEHARHYLNIQKIRYRNLFDVRITAQPGTEGLFTLKLTIQPLLENAITHGMAGSVEDGLTILSEPDEGTTVRVRLPALNEAAAEHYRQEDSL